MPDKMNKSNEKNSKNKSSTNAKNKNTVSTPLQAMNANRWLLLPILCILTVLPLITRLKVYYTDFTRFSWFASNDEYTDFFLYYKQNFFILIAIIMTIILIAKIVKDKNSIRFAPIFWPLSIYAVFSFLSSIFTEYRKYSFWGSFEQFESIIVILGYCLIVYYLFLFVKTDSDAQYLIHGLLISSLIIGFIGVSQTFGHDFFTTDFAKSLITPPNFLSESTSLVFKFGIYSFAYGTLYNPNYLGVYVALLAPIFFILIIVRKKDLWTVIYGLSLIVLIISLFGSGSSAGKIAIVAAILFSIPFFWRYLIKYKKIFIPLFCLGILSIILLNFVNHNFMINKLANVTKLQKTNPTLTDIQTRDDCLLITYSGNSLKLQSYMDNNGAMSFILTDDSGQPVAQQANQDGAYSIVDNRFPGFLITPCIYDNIYGFNIKIDGIEWYFSNYTGDGTYYYYNLYGKFDKIETAPSAVFTGYEYIFTDRGYIWSRTIPLLKKYFFLGAGANNFSLVFPQRDYVNQNNFNHGTELITRPHSLYLQIAVQNGMIAFLAFLAFYLWYFIQSIKIYIKGTFDNLYTQIGFSLFIGSIGYMICGITNDSLVVVAPIFWTLVGLGILINYKIINAAAQKSK